MLFFFLFHFSSSWISLGESFNSFDFKDKIGVEQVFQNKNAEHISFFFNFKSNSNILYDIVARDETHVSYINDSTKESFFVEGSEIIIKPKSALHLDVWGLDKSICANTGISFKTSDIIRFDLMIGSKSSQKKQNPVCFFGPAVKNNQFDISIVPASEGYIYTAEYFQTGSPIQFKSSISQKTYSESFVRVKPSENSA